MFPVFGQRVAIDKDIIYIRCAGGRLKKSAIDASLLLLDRIQQQRKKGKVTTVVFLDIKGAFDHVALNQLLATMVKLGLPVSLLSWIQSFMSGRQLRLYFNNQMEVFQPHKSGIPQGSPISPILFNIYTRDLFQTHYSSPLSYIDDLSLSVSSTSLKKNIRLLEKDIANLFNQAKACSVQFDPAKTELIHFTTSKKAEEKTLTLPDSTIIPPAKVVRWLGIHFDSALSFKEHCSIRTSQAKSAFYRMCRLANIETGLSPFAIRQLYLACVVSVADYGSALFWKGQKSTLKQLQALQNAGIRKILGTFRTTPVIPSEVEAALPPPAVRLDSSLRQYAFRARKLPQNHPIHKAIQRLWNKATDQDTDSGLESDSDRSTQKHNKGPPRQMERIAQSIQKILSSSEEKIVSHCFPPWKIAMPYQVHISKLSKEEEAAEHLLKIPKTRTDLLAIYSDASSVPNGSGIGVGMTAFDYSRNGRETYQEMVNLGKGQIVYNGELEGITRALEFAARRPRIPAQVCVYADNQAALYRLKTPSDNPGQEWQLRCITAAKQIQRKGSQVTISWVPGHTDIPGNEIADGLAKRAAKRTPSTNTTSLAMTGIKIKQVATSEWQDTLKAYTSLAIQKNPNTYAAKYSWKIRKKLVIPTGTKRETASTFFQLKTGHGYNKAFLHRIGKSDSPLCSCGAKQTPEHLLLSCKWIREDRKILSKDLDTKHMTLPLLLHTSKGIKATLAFINRTKIGTRKWHLGQTEE